MRKVFRELRPYKWQIIVALATVVIGSMAELGLPNLMSMVIDKGVLTGNKGYIFSTGVWMLLLAVVSLVCALLTGFLGAKVSAGFGTALRKRIFSKIETLSHTDMDRIGTASLITRSTNDVMQIQNFVMVLIRMVLKTPIIAVGGVCMAYLKSPKLSMVLLVSLPVLVLLVVLIARFATPLSIKMQEKIDKVNLIMREKLTGVRVIRAFNNENYELDRFDKANNDLTRTTIWMQRTMSFLLPSAMIVMYMTTVSIVWFGGLQASYGNLLVGDIMAMVQYVTQILMAIMMLSLVFVMLPRAAASAKRINEVLDVEASIHDPKAPVKETGKRGYVAFEHVSFAYPNAEDPSLSDISFEAGPGEVTAIIGSTGSGKSTLVNLIPRFYDVTAGRVLIDGEDARNYRTADLRQKIGYVPQKSVLFSGTIESNIRYGDDSADDARVWEAAEISQSAEFISEKEDKLESPISQGGVNVSGGQKQRLSIARAVARKPEIYIFDDSFSALDFATDAKLRAALSEQTKDATVFIVAQRVSTIMNANRIIVLDSGVQVGNGTHRELLKTCDIYREIVSSQLSPEEMDL